MRKNLILFLMSVLVLTACSNNTPNETQEVETEVTQTESTNISNADTIRGCDINDIKFVETHVSDAEEPQFEDSFYYMEADELNDTDDEETILDDGEPHRTIEHEIEEILKINSGLEEDDPDVDKLIEIFLKDSSPKFTMSELGTRKAMINIEYNEVLKEDVKVVNGAVNTTVVDDFTSTNSNCDFEDIKVNIEGTTSTYTRYEETD